MRRIGLAVVLALSFFAALYASFQEHQYCGELDGGVEDDKRLDDVYERREHQCG